MRQQRRAVMAGLAVLAIAEPARAQGAAPPDAYLVIYVELAPGALPRHAGALRQALAQIKAAPGNQETVLLQELARPNRFVLLEAWRDKASAVAAAPAHDALKAALAPDLIGGLDLRPHSPFLRSPPANPPVDAAYVVTHVDSFPQGMQHAIDLLTADVALGRQDDGALRLEVLRWEGHINHFSLVSAWRDRKAAEASLAAPHMRAMRAELAPIEGAPHDARIYRVWR
jgi:quinol monooxygenase YgiN